MSVSLFSNIFLFYIYVQTIFFRDEGLKENKCPEFFCSRPVRQVHIYRKALGLSTGPNKTEDCDEEWPSSADENQTGGSAADANWETWQKQRRVTPKSDVDLYEGRFELEFEEGTELSQHLPTAATPEG